MGLADDLQTAAGATELTLGHVLGLLARRGTVLIVAGQDGGIEICQEDRDGLVCIGRAERAIVDEGVQRGWVENCPTDASRWRMTAAGRAALRKLKSASDEAMQAAGPPVLPANGQQGAMQVPESPLAWLRRRKDKAGRPLISVAQFDAGERLRADLWFSDMTPRTTVNWSACGTGGTRNASGLGVDMLDRTVAAQQRVRLALAATGPEFAGLLIDVCGHLKGLEEIEMARIWPPRSGKVVLQLALTALARHYGFIASHHATGVGGLQHWGSADYRPHA